MNLIAVQAELKNQYIGKIESRGNTGNQKGGKYIRNDMRYKS